MYGYIQPGQIDKRVLKTPEIQVIQLMYGAGNTATQSPPDPTQDQVIQDAVTSHGVKNRHLVYAIVLVYLLL